jgi:hypothetical protein
MSGWGNASQSIQWQFDRMNAYGKSLLGIKIKRFLVNNQFHFQFISSTGDWYGPDDDTSNVQCSMSNVQTSEIESRNFVFDPHVTGNNILQYHLSPKIALVDSLVVEFSYCFPYQARTVCPFRQN